MLSLLEQAAYDLQVADQPDALLEVVLSSFRGGCSFTRSASWGRLPGTCMWSSI